MEWIIAIAALIVSYALTAFMTPKQQQPKPAALQDFQFAQIEEGTPQTVYFGDCWTQGFFVLWYGNLRTKPIKAKGGKK